MDMVMEEELGMAVAMEQLGNTDVDMGIGTGLLVQPLVWGIMKILNLSSSRSWPGWRGCRSSTTRTCFFRNGTTIHVDERAYRSINDDVVFGES